MTRLSTGKYNTNEEFVEAITLYRSQGYTTKEIVNKTDSTIKVVENRISRNKIPLAKQGRSLLPNEQPDQAYMLEVFIYDGKDLRWKNPMSNNRVKAGSIAGYIDSYGYRVINLAHDRLYKAHQLVILYIDGYLPTERGQEVDHKNGIRDDNRRENLEPCSRIENSHNMGKSHRNTSGYPGVTKRSADSWEASIGVNGTTKYLGIGKTAKEAYNLRLAAEKEYEYHKDHAKYDVPEYN